MQSSAPTDTGLAPSARKNLGSSCSPAHHGCQALKRQLHASYRVWWRWEGPERVWWAKLTVTNRTAQSMDASLHGTFRATGVSRGRWSRRPVATIRWGGSSDDSLWIRPNRTTRARVPGPGRFGEVHTSATGSLEVTDIGVAVYMPDVDAWWCSLPVPQDA